MPCKPTPGARRRRGDWKTASADRQPPETNRGLLRADAFARKFARPPAQNIWAGQCVCVLCFLQVRRRLRIIHQGRTKRRRCLAAACKVAGLLCGHGRHFGIPPGRRRNSWRAAQSVGSLQKRKICDAFSWASRGEYPARSARGQGIDQSADCHRRVWLN